MAAPALPENFFNKTADVYTMTPRTRTLLRRHLPCRVNTISLRGVGGGNERRELLRMRKLIYDPSYEMPLAGARLIIDGEAWNVVVGSISQGGPNEAIAFGRCEIERATSA